MGRRVCLDCRIAYEGQGSRCARCQREWNQQRNARRPWYRGDYPKVSAIVRATPTSCAICGEWDRPGDPWECHHITPTVMSRAHRSCNIKDGSKHPVFHKAGTDANRPGHLA